MILCEFGLGLEHCVWALMVERRIIIYQAGRNSQPLLMQPKGLYVRLQQILVVKTSLISSFTGERLGAQFISIMQRSTVLIWFI